MVLNRFGRETQSYKCTCRLKEACKRNCTLIELARHTSNTNSSLFEPKQRKKEKKNVTLILQYLDFYGQRTSGLIDKRLIIRKGKRGALMH